MTRPFHIASVSYLNAKPLIEGLEAEPRVRLSLAVPSALLSALADRSADVALLPVIDYQRMEDLIILPAGAIGSDGETLTVRIFSRMPIAQINQLGCDSDSHTSVALARIILARRYGLRPEFGRLADGDQARLLIGDKVVCAEPAGFSYQLDLGAEWKAMTGLPFVFATWMARSDIEDPAALYEILHRARERGLAAIDRIIDEHARPGGWPADLARRYLTQNLRFGVGPRELEAIRLFHKLAGDEGLIEHPRELHVWGL